MSTLLHIEVSPSGEASVSRSITREYVKSWLESHPDGNIVMRDLAQNPIPHLDGEGIKARFTPESERTNGQAAKHQYRLDLIQEILSSDEILISAPMWNYGIPSVLKAYFDQIIMNGVLDAGANRKLSGKKVTFVVSQGGSYKDGSRKAGWDYATGYLRLVGQALGSEDVEVILAEFTLAGVNPAMASLVEAKQNSLAAAKADAARRAAA